MMENQSQISVRTLYFDPSVNCALGWTSADQGCKILFQQSRKVFLEGPGRCGITRYQKWETGQNRARKREGAVL